MNSTKKKLIKRAIRHNRVRSKIYGTEERPRLSVFRANKHIYAQVINDVLGHTIASASSKDIKSTKDNKTSIATKVGKLIAEKAVKGNITTVVFDRGGFAYHGRIKALAEAAREGGLKF